MGCEPIDFKKLCGDDEKFSECGKLIREVITKRGICIDKEMINFGYKPPEILFRCGVGRGLIEEEKAGSGIKSYDCFVLSKVIRKEPDFWLSVNGQPCLIEIKVNDNLNSLIFGNQGKKDDISELLVHAEFPNSLVKDCRSIGNRIQDELRENLKNICEFSLEAEGKNKAKGKNIAIDGSIYDIFKWIKHIDKIKVSLSLAFFVDTKNSLYQCLDKKVCCERCLNAILCSLLKWKKVLNKQLNVSYNYHIKMAIYKSKMEGKDIPLILFMTETRYKPINQPSNQTQGGST